MSFAQLLQELQGETEALAKALPADDSEGDEKIAAAAAEGGSQGEGEPDGDEKKPGAGDGDGDEKPPMAKSFQVTLPDGSQADAVDATELVKSLQEQVGTLSAKIGENEGTFTKALETTLGLVKSQNALIKSLSERVTALAGEGRGRKSTVAIAEKPVTGGDLAKSEPSGMQPSEFMLKANAAYDTGKISGVELGAIDVSLRNGTPLDRGLIARDDS